VVADAYSRRISVIIGEVLIGLAFVLQGLLPFFGAILIAQVIWGIGHTFTSGALDAWIADETDESRAGRIYLRGAQVGMLCGILGTLTGIVLGSLQLTAPVMLGGVLFIGQSVFLVLFMPEHGFKPKPRESRSTWQHLRRTFTDGVQTVRRRPVLLTILGIGVVFGAFSEGYDRLWQAHFLENISLPGTLEPVAWFGLMNIGAMLIGLAAAEIARRRIDTNSHAIVARALLVISAVLSLGVITFGLAERFAVAVAAFGVIALLRTVRDPLTSAWVNQSVDSQVRATVLSMSSQADALGQLAVGPAIGAIGVAFGLRTALVVAGILLAPALLLYVRTLNARSVVAAV
jgi:DHA3 family tetracycline resistance protein-like MFS transporter